MPTSTLAFRKTELLRILPVPTSLVISMDRYLATLMPFVAPVVSMEASLSKYRRHGANLWLVEPHKVLAKRLEVRLRSERAITREIPGWLRKHEEIDVGAPGVKSYLKEIDMAQVVSYINVDRPTRREHTDYLLHGLRTAGRRGPCPIGFFTG
jgi:hypothetical protein